MAERLPNWYSSKQGLTEESPAVFGTAGMGLTHAGGGMSDIQGRLWHEDGTLCGLITQHLADLSSTPTSRL